MVFLDGSGVEGQPPKAGAAAVQVKGVGQETELIVEKVVYEAASHGEVQSVADVVGRPVESVTGDSPASRCMKPWARGGVTGVHDAARAAD